MNLASPIDAGECPVPTGLGSVLVYGGTFDPPHRAHIDLPKAACDQLGLGWLLYVPAASNPLKADGPIADDNDRVDMLRAALRGIDRVSISTIELERSGLSYTVDTLRDLQTRLPSTRLRLLIGADQAASFHRWREPKEIIRLAEPAVMLRAPLESADALIDSMRPNWTPSELEAWRGRIVPVPLITITSTETRHHLRSVANDSTLEHDIPAGVLRIIRERRLYRDH